MKNRKESGAGARAVFKSLSRGPRGNEWCRRYVKLFR
jgi:hypothetical protein